ncbi:MULTISPECIES: amidohydrolase family protein [Tsukamurella]|uniref:Amidohydrolase family protein n=1 Tax=Tsukamurella strandjordii TaxID=147577 RepID=A0AA90N7F7_9ACTN|nr:MULTISPECIES: amidohydrolase family protein [Tsukamurella]MDP0396977.1 amidohydrolase family protein [Tsukamurella strandjordii]GIZ96779.1 2-pyrone-4,6-dicarboxylate hydrolase [Tsukamurella sp. TY48]
MAEYNVFDSHFHIIDHTFPVVENNGFLPDHFDVAAYQVHADRLKVVGGAVVSGSFQEFDQTYLRDALTRLGPGFVGVTQLPASVTDAEITDLDRAGVRAVRFNVRRGGSESIGNLETFARRVHEVAGWHTELYVDAADLAELVDVISGLPAVSVDHLGLTDAGLPVLLELVERGVRVKATGFGRVELDVREAVRRIMDIDPTALMFGSDLPSTRARRPFEDADIDLLIEEVGDDADAVLRTNAERFYRISEPR